jgi:hypothetical protein
MFQTSPCGPALLLPKAEPVPRRTDKRFCNAYSARKSFRVAYHLRISLPVGIT